MKKIITVLLSAAMIFSMTACSGTAKPGNDTDKIKVVTTVFPEYDWVREVAGKDASNIDCTMLLDNGVDIHSFQPSAEDILKIKESDIFLYVGGESEEWVEDVLSDKSKTDQKVIKLMDLLKDDIKEEETVEGMQEEEGEGEEEDEAEYDEHLWLSLKMAQKVVTKIAEDLSAVDAAGKERYESNAKAYNEKLSALDARYKETVDNAAVKTIVVADRFPFRYLADDYGLKYYAAFAGCSAETEAKFDTVVFLAGKIDELGLKSVLTIEGGNNKIAETVISNTKDKDAGIKVLDSLQSTTSKDIEAGRTYLSVMESNLEVLKEVLK